MLNKTTKINGNIVPKFLVIVLSVSMLVSLSPLMGAAYGADSVPDTARHIKTAAELAAIGGVQSKGEYYVLDNNINLAAEWVPIDDFRGTFDGQGYSVNNLYVLESSKREYAGLFGCIYVVDVVIKNVGVNIGPSGVTASGSGDVCAGGLIGYARGGIQDNLIITNCYATGNVIAVGGFPCAGGLIGWGCRGLTATNCYATGDVTATAPTGSACAGGLAGYEGGYSFKNCYATGDVVATSAYVSYAGGLIGRGVVMVESCYTTGGVTAVGSSYTYAGGILGYEGGSVVKNCYTTGDITATSSGQIGYAGGLIGEGGHTIENCYTTGDITATGSRDSLAGGLFGYFPSMSDSRVTRCYRLSSQTITGNTIENLGETLTSAEMKNQPSFVTWNFDTIWAINSKTNNGYPYLRNLSTTNSNPPATRHLTITPPATQRPTTHPQTATTQPPTIQALSATRYSLSALR
jgi:hypothetical protein